jgi:DnaK suppressor protein
MSESQTARPAGQDPEDRDHGEHAQEPEDAEDPEDVEGAEMMTVLSRPPAPPSPADDAARLAGIETELAGVEAALRRLDDGTYGTCEACGAGMDPATLAADPLVTRCPQHAA